jgi:hypothetical protein
MSADYEPLFSPRPFWFASSELLTNVLCTEINVVKQLLAKHPNMPDLLDAPEATVLQRSKCFALLAHLKLIEMIVETFTARYESPSLSNEQSKVLRRAQNLVRRDAPAWVLEINEVAELLPARINDALPGPLRKGGFEENNSAQVESAETLSSVKQIQAFTKGILDRQLWRVKRRWSAGIVQMRRRNKRKGWEKKEKLYEAIRRALKTNPSLQGMEFCAELDKRHAPPLFNWVKRGDWRKELTWKVAWRDPRLRRKIRRVRQEAQKPR